MDFPSPLTRGTLVARYKRFFADVSRTIARALNERGERPFGRGHHHANSALPGWEHTYVGDLLRSAAVEGDYEPGLGRRSYKKKTGERIVGYFGPSIVSADLVARARFAMAARKGGLWRRTRTLSGLMLFFARRSLKSTW